MASVLPDGVSWEQTEEDLEVSIAVQPSDVRADLSVRTSAAELSVWRRSHLDLTAWQPQLVGALRHAVEPSSVCWSVEAVKGGGRALVVQLEKARAPPARPGCRSSPRHADAPPPSLSARRLPRADGRRCSAPTSPAPSWRNLGETR